LIDCLNEDSNVIFLIPKSTLCFGSTYYNVSCVSLSKYVGVTK